MKLAVIGQTGQLAKAIAKIIKSEDVVVHFFDRQSCDLSGSKEDMHKALQTLPLDIHAVINAAAYTAVDQAETDQDTAFKVNGVAPGIIAQFCAARGVPLIHISTDYVFDGTASAPYRADMETNPINVYGRSKLAGEKAVSQAGAHYAILRTSWVFDATSKNFYTTMLRLGETRDALNVVADQFGRPTFAEDLAQAAMVVANKLTDDGETLSGVYHVSNSGEPISWNQFAQAIFDQTAELRPHTVTVTPIPSEQYPTPAKRPAYSVLDTTEYETTFKHVLPHWKESLRRAIDATIASTKEKNYE